MTSFSARPEGYPTGPCRRQWCCSLARAPAPRWTPLAGPYGEEALCNTSSSVHVATPRGQQLGAVSMRLRVCDFQVHPLVAGLTGSPA
jgi:hypothetical protein